MPTCFVVGPIGDSGSPTRGHADWLFEGIIAPVFAEHFTDFEVVRSDKIAQPGMIDSQVINHLLDAELVIADMSSLNANAFYEIGLRHMERKPIIHMFRAGEMIPFDVKPYRAIPFSFEHPKHLSEAREYLRQAIDAVLDPNYQVENPVTRARGFAAVSQHATADMQVLLMEMESLKSRLQSVELSAAVAQDTAMRALGSPIFGANVGAFSGTTRLANILGSSGTGGGFGSSFGGSGVAVGSGGTGGVTGGGLAGMFGSPIELPDDPPKSPNVPKPPKAPK